MKNLDKINCLWDVSILCAKAVELLKKENEHTDDEDDHDRYCHNCQNYISIRNLKKIMKKCDENIEILKAKQERKYNGK